MTTTDLAPPTDDRTAQEVAPHAVLAALRGWSGHITHGGDTYELTEVRDASRPGELPGLITGTLSDGTREHAISLTIHVSGVGLP